MKTVWEGRYFDGKTGSVKRAEVRLLENGLGIVPEGEIEFVWPYEQIVQAQGRYSGEPVRLERGTGRFEALSIDDTDFLNSLRSMVPGSYFRFHNPRFRRARLWLTIYASVATLLAGLVLYQWGIPLLVHHVTPLVPV